MALAVSPAVQGQALGGALTGRISVLDGANTVPVRRARVTLTPSAGEVQHASTEADGRYRFDGLRLGRYSLDVVKPGFFVAANGPNGVATAGTIVEIDGKSAAIRDVTVERGAAVEGRLVHVNGDPAKNAVVKIRPFPDVNARLTDSIRPVRSDDRGFYRLHTLPAGEYIIEADVLSRRTADAIRGVTNGSPTYYPGVGEIQGARRIVVAPRSVNGGIDFALAVPQVASRPSPGTAKADPPPSPEATTRIGGRIASTDGSAIAGAIVNVMPWEPPSNAKRFQATTDERGRYEVVVVPGTYQIRVMADGFATRAFGWAREIPKGRPVEVAAKQTFARADVTMPRHGAVEGRIVDEFGDPAAGVSVELATMEFGAGSPRLVPDLRSRPTDDRGVYRIFDVPPDDYYALALSGPFLRDSDSRVGGFALTLYPGTRRGSEAKPVQVGPGTDTLAVDFAAVPAVTSAVHGKVVTPDGVPVSRALVALMPLSSGDVRIMLTRASTNTAADGSFVFREIPEGSYAIHAQVSPFAPPASSGAPTTPVFGYTTLEVSAAAPADVLVEARPLASLAGRVVFEGEPAVPSDIDVQIRTVPVDFVSVPFETRVQNPRWADRNTFTLDGLVGRQVIRATARPDSWVLSRVLLRGVDVTDKPIDFGRGDVTDLEITFSSTGGTISGRVTDGNDLAADYRVIVFAEDPLKWAWPSRYIALGQPNQSGEYRISGLPPGDYRAVALSEVPSALWRSEDFLKGLVGRSVSVRVQPGQALSVVLKLAR